jgi:hypothetical protein
MQSPIHVVFLLNLEAGPANSAKNLCTAVSAVTLARQEEVQLPRGLHLWQHLMPEISQKNKDVPKAKGKPLLDGTKFLMACQSHTIQLVTHLHLMIPVVQEIIQAGNLV